MVQNDAPVLLEAMRSQNLLSRLQLLVPDAASLDDTYRDPSLAGSPTYLYGRMHEILDKVRAPFHW